MHWALNSQSTPSHHLINILMFPVRYSDQNVIYVLFPLVCYIFCPYKYDSHKRPNTLLHPAHCTTPPTRRLCLNIGQVVFCCGKVPVCKMRSSRLCHFLHCFLGARCIILRTLFSQALHLPDIT